jgi:hypothetical protein
MRIAAILNMKVFLLAAAGSGNLANEHSLDLLNSEFSEVLRTG